MLAGLHVRRVEVQADIANGEVKFLLVGLAATSVKEARERVRSAIKNSGVEVPPPRLTVNPAPPRRAKGGKPARPADRSRHRHGPSRQAAAATHGVHRRAGARRRSAS